MSEAAGARVPSGVRVAVVGAGAFGGWTALWLLRRGACVTLLDAWGAGNARASSGGETRAIRAIYGGDRIYSEWVARALELWRESDLRWSTQLYRQTGALWLCGGDDGYVRQALPVLAELGLGVRALDLDEAGRLFPQVSVDGIERVYLEEQAGTLLARRACEAVVSAFVAEGGAYAPLAARPGAIRGGTLEAIELSDASRLEADVFVFACGPWLPELFPDVLGDAVRISRQEVYYFGVPAGASRLGEAGLPIWMDLVEGYYGLPGSERRGFKLASSRRGGAFHPTYGDRVPTPEGIEAARAYLGRRFPELAAAPLLEARVCQYTNTPDGHLVVDTHPEATNLWIVGGGSGHGFKLGPALGEVVARYVLDAKRPDPQLAIGRLADPVRARQTLFDPPAVSARRGPGESL